MDEKNEHTDDREDPEEINFDDEDEPSGCQSDGEGSGGCCGGGRSFRVSPGAVFAGVECVVRKARNLDTQVSGNADALVSKVAGYFRRSIDTYKERKS